MGAKKTNLQDDEFESCQNKKLLKGTPEKGMI
jgi:hypothetical protein